MKLEILTQTRELLCQGFSAYCGSPVGTQQLKIPAKTDAAGLYLPGAGVPDRALFPLFGGEALVERVERRGDWLYVVYTDWFYDACVEQVTAALPLPGEDLGSYPINRMLALARKEGRGCPREEPVWRALWLTMAATEIPGLMPSAERALLSMAWHLPPRERQALYNRCGAVAGAAARLLYCLKTEAKA